MPRAIWSSGTKSSLSFPLPYFLFESWRPSSFLQTLSCTSRLRLLQPSVRLWQHKELLLLAQAKTGRLPALTAKTQTLGSLNLECISGPIRSLATNLVVTATSNLYRTLQTLPSRLCKSITQKELGILPTVPSLEVWVFTQLPSKSLALLKTFPWLTTFTSPTVFSSTREER